MGINFIQSGDWHIRVRPELPIEWQVLRYHRLAAELIDLCLRHEAKLFLSGDLFDRNRPSLIELQLFIEILICISDADIDTWLLSGNHEVIGQGKCTFDYLVDVFDSINRKRRGQIHYDDSSVIRHVYPEECVQFTFVGHPALNGFIELGVGKINDHTQVLITHVRPTINQFIREEVDVTSLISPFDYCFASDIHEPLELFDGRLVYTNSPLNKDPEANPNHGCLLITADDGQVQWKRIPLHLPNLIKVVTTAEDYKEPEDDGHLYCVEVRGAAADLRGITADGEHVRLMKVPEIAETYAESEDAEEIKDQELEQALIEYMQSLQFEQLKIMDMMEVYRDAQV